MLQYIYSGIAGFQQNYLWFVYDVVMIDSVSY